MPLRCRGQNNRFEGDFFGYFDEMQGLKAFLRMNGREVQLEDLTTLINGVAALRLKAANHPETACFRLLERVETAVEVSAKVIREDDFDAIIRFAFTSMHDCCPK